MNEPHVDVVLPCLDEEQALPRVLAALPAGYRAIVVDNGSTDRSAEVARSLGALVIEETRRGFGSAVNAGVEAATAPVIAICDADASLDLAELPRLVALLDGADLVLGRRVPTSPRAWPAISRLANRVVAARLGRKTGVRLHDIGPMRVARTSALQSLPLRDRRSGYPLEMVVRAAQAGWRIIEADVVYAPRVGRSKVTGTVRGFLTAVGDMSRILAERPASAAAERHASAAAERHAPAAERHVPAEPASAERRAS